ncbi:TetR/AcrR family transcriptional regulator [Treponema pectinovorum]|uniref:TetR/AcrR family transcriptional regulator n=1 Tax=Treponema pectinovorum TaxID=164 RepID=UPI0011F0AA4A|nr:TetR/AcrR family transcriptional regulator [Treponema pectinovorum]
MPAEKITREKIINAVLDCAFVKSVGGTSLADIAGKLGIKKASLYNHYDSREAMIEDTINYCDEYIKKIPLIPLEMDYTAQKYTAGEVLKGIVHRWFKVNEKEPLIQIYSFLESEKYFSSVVLKIAGDSKRKLVEQAKIALTSLANADKIKFKDEEKIALHAELFVSILYSILDEYIVEKKDDIRSNPRSGEGELFNSLPLEPDLKKTDDLIEEFCCLL